jgi:hypothetical protein
MGTPSSTYMFTHRAVLEKAPKASGVYSIFTAKRWVYVGESDDIQRSLFNRLNKPTACLQRYSPLSFSFAVALPTEREAQLDAMIAARSPACTIKVTNVLSRSISSPESSGADIVGRVHIRADSSE